MDLNDTPEQAEYRARVRAWLEEHKAEAPEARTGDAEQIARRRAWQRRLAEAGLAGVTWPREYGGQGLGPVEQVIVNQEIQRAGVPGVLDVIGVGMMGPCLIQHGTEEQKARYLGPLLHADETWCQLFSEPAAGSDLAGIETRAVREDDGTWVVNGQKVWSSGAHYASFGMLLARTDPDVPKHKGLTMFVVPMDAEGVTVRGLRQISGEAEFNEVFLDGVRLTDDHVVGGVGQGWRVALTVLMFERVALGLGSDALGYTPERFAKALAGTQAARSHDVRRRLGEVATELLAVRYASHRTLTALSRGQVPGPEAAMAKITTTSAAVRGVDLVVDVLGLEALEGDAGRWRYETSFLPGLKSAGGTDAILRNTVGERVLGLPPEPRVDKDVPFSELRSRQGQVVVAR